MARSRPTEPSPKALVSFTHCLADAAAKVTLKHFRKAGDVSDKGGGTYDPVTEGDRGAERAIVKLIAATYPEHGIVGEEFGNRNETARFRWVIDPIDGTRAFIMGQPLWGTLIGLLDEDRTVLGMMAQPFTGERYWASAAGAVWRRDGGASRALKTRSVHNLGEAVLTSTDPAMFSGADKEAFARLSSSVRMTRFGGDCYNYCLLAAGFIDVIVEVDLKPYDIVALIPIIERAGGVVTTWDGAPATSGGRIVASGNRRLHDATLKLLARK
jgi:histidinol phosphatase-like enzyme (inositol monophosphatase family)